ICCALLPVALDHAAPLWVGLSNFLGLRYQGLLLMEFLLVFALLVVPTTLMGATLPVLSQALVGDGAGARRDVGALYAINTSGAVSMLYEVGWTRALALAIGSSTYAFTSMLLAFLVGIAGGSALYSRLSPERQTSPAAFALLQAGIGVTTGATILLFERAPEMFLIGLRWSAAPEFVQLVQFSVSAGALLFSSLLIGATFPCAVAVIARNRTDIGRQVGRLYGANTVGAIVGSIVAGFVLL